MNEAPAEVVMIEAEKDNKAVLIPIALSVVLVVILAICVRQLMNKSDKEQLKEASNRAMKIKNMNEQELAESNVIDLGATAKQNDYGQVNRDSCAQTFEQSMRGGMDEYATQYDPNNDFAVFGVGDKTRGGVMSMKEKMNLADVVDEVQEEDSDEKSPVA